MSLSDIIVQENMVVHELRYRLLFSWRFYLSMLSFFTGMISITMQRLIVAEAILGMVDSDSKSNSGEQGEFSWSQTQQGIALSAYFWGYITTILHGGFLADRYSPTWVFFWPALGAGVCTLLVPFGARLHFGALVALRMITGMASV